MNSLFDTGIRPAVDEYLLAKAAEKRDYGQYWSASSAGYCMRKLIMERLGIPPVKEDARKQRVFSVGHIFHGWLQDITESAGISLVQEGELQDEVLMIRGHFDDIILIEGKYILYDYKTQNSRAFTWAKKNGSKMSHYHRMQLGTYLHMLNISSPMPELGKHLILEARILKISKDDLRMSEEQLIWSPELEKEVVAYWSTLNGYWKAEKLPKCTCDKYEGGFLAKPQYNPYFYNGEPCSIDWYNLNKKGK